MEVIEGMVPILHGNAHILIDSGSTHSFVSPKYVLFLRVKPEPLDCVLVVRTPSDTLTSRVIFRSCEVRIGDRGLCANLILLGITEFDVKLGMDWLSTHHAVVDCYNKVVEFCTPNQPRFQFIGEKRNLVPTVFLCIKAMDMLEHRCCGYLAYVLETRDKPMGFEGVRVVENFADVFPKEFSGLPLAKEIEFSIDLVSGTAPIS